MSELCPSPHACSWKGLISLHMFPSRVPYPPPMSHASPVTTSVPSPCPEVPPGCHRHIRSVSVSSCDSLVWVFHGEVVWELKGVPREEGGASLWWWGWVPGQVWGFGRIWGLKGVLKGEGQVWGWFGVPGAGF